MLRRKSPVSLQGILSIFSLAGSAAVALPAFHFPLDTGNIWVYRTSGPGSVQTRTVEVTGSRDVNGVRYAVVEGLFGAGALIRQDESGRLLIYDAVTRQERLWVPLADPQGTGVPSDADECTPTGSVASRAFVYDGPIGHYDTAIEITYAPRCADAGVTRDVFLPWVGLLQRKETSIAGLRTWDLMFASVGGNLFANASGVEFTLTLDQAAYKTRDTILARFALRNWRGTKPVVLTFSSGQEYDLVMYNEKGTEVYRWAFGKLFTQNLHTIAVANEKDWVVTIPLALVNGDKGLPPGKYVAEAYLTNTAPQREYLSRVGFTIE